MSPSRLGTEGDVRSNPESLFRFLGLSFGFFVWAVHFLAIYVATAVACQLGLGVASAETRATFLTVLALVTVVSATIVVVHAIRRHRQDRDMAERRFRIIITVGGDAIAAVVILWQLFPILLLPVCA